MISICIPTRGRPERFAQAVASARGLARGEIEVIARVDKDDEALPAYKAQQDAGLRVLVGRRETQSNLWNRCWAQASGDIAMLAADDIIFRTPAWDRLVCAAFERFPDRIACVYGNDGTRWRQATLPFLSREWIDTAGTFTPPYFKSWFADRWIWEIAAFLDRLVYLQRLMIEHRHAAYRKAPKDQTYLDAEMFRAQQDPKALYFEPRMIRERTEQINRLGEYIYANRGTTRTLERTLIHG